MRCVSNSLGMLACIGLVAMQLSGVHMHVDAGGYVGVPEGPHTHGQAGSHGHHHDSHALPAAHGADEYPADTDYEGTKDVSVLEMSGGAAKLVVAIFCLTFLLPVPLWQSTAARPAFAVPRLGGRQFRWRPPLRAPPQ